MCLTESLRARCGDALVINYPGVDHSKYVVSDFISLISSITSDTSIRSFMKVVCARASHAACIASCNVMHVQDLV